jgi:hypothetical protein
MSATRRSSAEPEDLMRDFRGGGLMRFVVLAVVVHAVVILATSIPWLRETLMGSATAGMTDEEKLQAAVKEATSKISAIAKEHGVSPQELGARFGGSGKATTQPSKDTPSKASPPTGPAPAVPADAGPATAAPGSGNVQPPPPGDVSPSRPPTPPVPPGPSLPAVDDNVDLFK